MTYILLIRFPISSVQDNDNDGLAAISQSEPNDMFIKEFENEQAVRNWIARDAGIRSSLPKQFVRVRI